MVQRRQRERSLFEVLLPDGHKLWPDWLRTIDTLLEDEAVIEVVAQALETRWPQSRRRGRPGTPAEVVIRMLILKHLFDWSYDDLEREVRANLVYRMFTRIDAGDVPDAKTILKIARAVATENAVLVVRVDVRAFLRYALARSCQSSSHSFGRCDVGFVHAPRCSWKCWRCTTNCRCCSDRGRTAFPLATVTVISGSGCRGSG